VNAEQMVNGGWIEYRFIRGSKKFRSTRIGIDSELDPRSVCSLPENKKNTKYTYAYTHKIVDKYSIQV